MSQMGSQAFFAEAVNHFPVRPDKRTISEAARTSDVNRRAY